MKKKESLAGAAVFETANDALLGGKHRDLQGLTEMLIQCQDVAIQIGNSLEEMGEQYAPVVHLLEDYCENIYRMSISLADERTCCRLAEKVRRQLTELQNKIRYEVPDDKKEVVFLPYKASMWDSLESVWKRMEADGNTDAYVIPIPYFDKNPDGSFREEHYEGSLYPDYVPITRYDAYDFQNRKPDEIYIHNPYDECNHVTSVHPFFYSKNIKKYTDKLIYIPYFILREIEPDDQGVIDGMKHFCFIPGTIYADQVIVQSEKIREIYINEYLKAAKEMGLSGKHVDRKFLEKKFLGLGSPKIEKILNTKKDKLEIPLEWLEIIEKPDKSWKKIIFYNTSINALLKHGEAILKKMEDVFQIFKENKDKTALLWRPHPLIESTLTSMRPQLWESYKRMRDRYIDEGWGIYDDSVDIDRAVILSDAYYGDDSSVVVLYQKTGKSILIQNVNVIKGSRDHLEIEDFYYKDGCVFFLSHEPNALWKYSYKTQKIELLCVLGKKYDYQTLFEYGENIILLPYCAKDIKIYNIHSNVLDTVKIKDTICDGYLANEYLVVCKIENVLYCVGDLKSQILVITLPEFTVTLLQEMNYRELLMKGINVYSHRKVACVVNGSLFIALNQNGKLAEYNTVENSMICHDIPNCDDLQISIVVFDGEYFWFAGNKNKLIRWDKNKNLSLVIELNNLESKDDDFSWKDWFSNAVVLENYIFFAPLYARDFIKINKDTMQVETLFKIESDQMCFVMKYLCDGKIFAKIEDEKGNYENCEIDIDSHVTISDFSHLYDDLELPAEAMKQLKNSEEVCKGQLKVLILDSD